MRKSIKIIGIGCGLPLLLLAVGTAWLAWKLRPEPQLFPPPELVRNLPRNYMEARAAFESRVTSRFPIGSRQSDLVAELRRQGFSLYDGTRAHFTQRDLVCTREWSINWQADSQARLQSIGTFHYLACL
jgi:hypothetical protein